MRPQNGARGMIEPLDGRGRLERIGPDEGRRITAAATRLAGIGGGRSVHELEREVRGRLRRWPRPVRALLLALLEGHSRRAALAHAGISESRLRQLLQASEPLADAVHWAEQAGLASVIEAELWRRAMAGTADRGSVQALLAIARARLPEHREASMVQLDLTRRAVEAVRAVAAGWQSTAVEADAVVIEGELGPGQDPGSNSGST